jgi:putative DNA primase/helicase
MHREKFWVLLGESRTGKSTVLYVLEHLIGKVNCSYLALDLFAERFQLDATRNKLLNIFAETETLRTKVIATLKMFTSGETISVDRKFGGVYNLTPTARLVCASNNLPAITDNALWERLTVIPFDRVVAEADRNATLKPELVSEELGGIFHWALQGLTRLTQRDRFTSSPAIDVAKNREQSDADPVSSFLKLKYQTGPSTGFIPTHSVQQAFEKWCIESNIAQPDHHDILLGRAIRKLFPSVERKQPSGAQRMCRYWGLQPKPDQQQAVK